VDIGSEVAAAAAAAAGYSIIGAATAAATIAWAWTGRWDSSRWTVSTVGLAGSLVSGT